MSSLQQEYKRMTMILAQCQRRLAKHDMTFDWDEIILGLPDAPIDKIKHRLSKELFLSDNDVLHIMQVLVEEIIKAEASTA